MELGEFSDLLPTLTAVEITANGNKGSTLGTFVFAPHKSGDSAGDTQVKSTGNVWER